MSDFDARRDLVARLFMTLTPIHSFESVGDGWTCDTFRVNEEWIVQIARGERESDMLRTQMGVLPELGREVSTAVPVPELVSRDPAAMAYRRIDGAEPAGADGIWPERLGRFLYDLHMVPPEFVGMRAHGPQEVRAALDRRLEDVRERGLPLLDPVERDASDERFRAFLEDELLWRFSPCLAHNDLVRAHILVSSAGDLAGVIDWEEVGIGDPAIDFAWILGEESEAGERALGAYGGAPDPGFRERCAFLFALAPWSDVLHGLDTEQAGLVARGLAAARERAGR